MSETALCTRCKDSFPVEFKVIKGQSCPIKQCLDCRAQNKVVEKNRGKRVRIQKSVAGGPKIDWDAKTVACVRCSRSFPLEFRKIKGVDVAIANCKRCRDIRKEIESKRKDDPKRLASRQLFTSGEKHKEGRRRFFKTEKGKSVIAKGRKVRKEKIRKHPGLLLDEGLRSAMIKMLSGFTKSSQNVEKYTGIKTAKKLMLHFESTFTAGMTRENFGYGPGKWSVGHIIPKCMYNLSNDEEMKRCQTPANLVAQWCDDNMISNVKLPNTDVLMALKNQWPLSWNGQLPTDRKALEQLAREGKLHY